MKKKRLARLRWVDGASTLGCLGGDQGLLVLRPSQSLRRDDIHDTAAASLSLPHVDGWCGGGVRKRGKDGRECTAHVCSRMASLADITGLQDFTWKKLQGLMLFSVFVLEFFGIPPFYPISSERPWAALTVTLQSKNARNRRPELAANLSHLFAPPSNRARLCPDLGRSATFPQRGNRRELRPPLVAVERQVVGADSAIAAANPETPPRWDETKQHAAAAQHERSFTNMPTLAGAEQPSQPTHPLRRHQNI